MISTSAKTVLETAFADVNDPLEKRRGAAENLSLLETSYLRPLLGAMLEMATGVEVDERADSETAGQLSDAIGLLDDPDAKLDDESAAKETADDVESATIFPEAAKASIQIFLLPSTTRGFP